MLNDPFLLLPKKSSIRMSSPDSWRPLARTRIGVPQFPGGNTAATRHVSLAMRVIHVFEGYTPGWCHECRWAVWFCSSSNK